MSPSVLIRFANKRTFLIYLVPQCSLIFSFVYLNFVYVIVIIKRIVPVLDSDWLSCVRSRCKLLYKHTPLFTLCVAWQPLYSNHNRFRGTTLFGGRILFLLISLQFICSVLFCETLLSIWNKSKKPREETLCFASPLSCYKFTVNHGFLWLIAFLY